jgi:hypothetical protein
VCVTAPQLACSLVFLGRIANCQLSAAIKDESRIAKLKDNSRRKKRDEGSCQNNVGQGANTGDG